MVLGDIGDAAGDQTLDDRHHLDDVVGGARLDHAVGLAGPIDIGRHEDAEMGDILVELRQRAVGQFADVGLLDEILLSVAPVTLGAGAPLLPRRLTARLR